VSLVHMKSLDVLVSQGTKHSHPADPQDYLLTQPIVLVSSVEKMGQRPVPLRILRKVRVQKIDRHAVSSEPPNLMFPGTEVNGATVHGNRGPLFHLLQEIIDDPCHGLLDLPPARVDPLVEVALPIQQGHSDHGHAGVRRRADRITGEHPETAAVGRNRGLQSDLHREVGDHAIIIHRNDLLALGPRHPWRDQPRSRASGRPRVRWSWVGGASETYC